MCPLCLSTLGWIAVGGTGSGTLAALIIAVRRRKPEEEDNDRPTDRDP